MNILLNKVLFLLSSLLTFFSCYVNFSILISALLFIWKWCCILGKKCQFIICG